MRVAKLMDKKWVQLVVRIIGLFVKTRSKSNDGKVSDLRYPLE